MHEKQLGRSTIYCYHDTVLSTHYSKVSRQHGKHIRLGLAMLDATLVKQVAADALCAHTLLP